MYKLFFQALFNNKEKFTFLVLCIGLDGAVFSLFMAGCKQSLKTIK